MATEFASECDPTDSGIRSAIISSEPCPRDSAYGLGADQGILPGSSVFSIAESPQFEPAEQAGHHIDGLPASHVQRFTDEWWKKTLEVRRNRIVAGVIAAGFATVTLLPTMTDVYTRSNSDDVVVDANDKDAFSSYAELSSAISMNTPEHLTLEAVEAEASIYQTILNNRAPYSETASLEDQNSWIWRGAVIMQVVLDTEEGKQTSAWLRLDNPYEVSLGDKVYWVAYSPAVGKLLTIEFGDKDDSGGIVVNDGYSLSEPRPFMNDQFSGQRVSAKPLAYDQQGLRVFDNYELLLRDNSKELLASAGFYLSKEESIAGLGKPLYIGDDTEYVNRDHNSLGN